jgi:hypothetical protein
MDVEKWAVYLYIFMLVITIATVLTDEKRYFLENSPFGGYLPLVIIVIVTVGEAALWFWAIQRKWQYFE